MTAARTQQVLQYADYQPLKLDPRIVRYKDFTFAVGPTTCRVNQESRLAEYQYLFTDGIDYELTRGATRITLEGIAIPNGLKRETSFQNTINNTQAATRTTFTERFFDEKTGNFAQSAAAYFYERMRSLQNGIGGVLYTPGLGVFSSTYLVGYTFSEDGNNPRQLNYTLEFLVGSNIKPISKINKFAVPSPQEAAPVDQQNVEYTIKSGDTLSAIASKYNVSLSLLKQLNPSLFDTRHKNGNRIFPGEVVVIKKTTAGTEDPTVFSVKNKNSTTSINDVPREEQLKVIATNKGSPFNEGGIGSLYNGIRQTVIDSAVTIKAMSKSMVQLPQPLYYDNTAAGLYNRAMTTLDQYKLNNNQTVESKATEPFPIFSGIVQYFQGSKIDSSQTVKQK